MFKVFAMPARTLAWWLDQKDDIDFSPIYQRKSKIWSPKDKKFLIDSILNEFDMPKIYLADFTFMNTGLNRAKKKYAIIDGKQRFETIFEFFAGLIVLEDTFELTEDPSLRLGGLSFKDLTLNYPRVARKFENFNLMVMSVITDDDSKINELFVRLNHSRPLTGGELRNAMLGDVPELIRMLVAHPFFTRKISFNTQRSQDKNVAAKLLLIEHRGQLVDTKKKQLDMLVEEARPQGAPQAQGLPPEQDDTDTFAEKEVTDRITETMEETESADIEGSAGRVKTLLNRMTEVFTDQDPLLAAQAPIIPYYWLIRGLDEKRLGQVRPFLVDFEAKLKYNRGLDVLSGTRDAELDSYYTMSRTSNDAGSMRGRYRILRERFDSAYPAPDYRSPN